MPDRRRLRCRNGNADAANQHGAAAQDGTPGACVPAMTRSPTPFLPCSTGCRLALPADRDVEQPVPGARRPSTVRADAHPMGIDTPHALPHDPSPHLEKTR